MYLVDICDRVEKRDNLELKIFSELHTPKDSPLLWVGGRGLQNVPCTSKNRHSEAK